MEQLWLFALLVFGIVALPGMDMAFVLSSTLADGRRGGFAALAGIVAGGIAHTAMGTLGIGLLQAPVNHLARLYSSDFRLIGMDLQTSALLLAGGAFLGLAGSWLAAARHLRSIEPTA